MRWVRFGGLLCLATVLQASLLAGLDIRPNLLLILLVFFAVYCSTTKAIIASFAIGFAADIIGSSMGPEMISFGLCGTSLAYLNRIIVIRKMPHQSLAIFITGFLAGTFAYFLTLLKGQPSIPNTYTTIFWTSLLCSSLVGPFLFLPSAWWMRIRKHKP